MPINPDASPRLPKDAGPADDGETLPDDWTPDVA